MDVNESGFAAAQKPVRELVEGDLILAGGARVRIAVVDLTRTDRNGWVEVEVSDTTSLCSHEMPPSLTFRPGELVTVIGHDAA